MRALLFSYHFPSLIDSERIADITLFSLRLHVDSMLYWAQNISPLDWIALTLISISSLLTPMNSSYAAALPNSFIVLLSNLKGSFDNIHRMLP